MRCPEVPISKPNGSSDLTTPQGSPLSPILSVLYTANLLELRLEETSKWSLRDLMMYVDDSAIYVTSATTKGATESAAEGYTQVLNWLH